MLKINKKNIIITIILAFIFVLIGSTQANAVLDENAELSVDNKNIYNQNASTETVAGASYDIDTNTLTLNGYNSGPISAYMMNGLKINVVGENTITYDGAQNGGAIYAVLGTLDIIGTGTLNINEINASSITETTWGNIKNLDSTLTINGPTINILNVVNSGIVSGANINIESAKININTSGEYGIYAGNGDINISGKSILNLKTTSDDESAIVIYAKNGKINLKTEEKVVLEKAEKGILSSPEIEEEYETVDTIYKYDVINETNKISYQYSGKVAKTLIDLIEIDGTNIIPSNGSEPKYLVIDSEKYEIINQEWLDENDELVTKFEEGKTYLFTIALKAKENYYFSDVTEANISKMDDTYVLHYADEPMSDSTSYENIVVAAEIEIPKVNDGVEGDKIQEGEKEDETVIKPEPEIKNETEVEVEPETKTESENVTTNNPKTGDNIVLFIVMFGISLVGIIITTKYRKNNK